MINSGDKKKILMLAHYYFPDVASTGQIMKDLAEGMREEFEVTVICTVPSYNGSIDEKYKKQKYYFESINGVNVIRVNVPPFQKDNRASRIRNISVYFFRALKAIRQAGDQDYIFALSQPPILGGLLGKRAKKIKKAKLIYCIQDFNPEQIITVGYLTNTLLLKFLMKLDRSSCRHSDLVITVGQDLVETLKGRFQNKDVPHHVMINNWIDQTEVYPLQSDDENVTAFKEKYGLTDKFVFMYSGNIGLYYDLENLIRVIKRFRRGYTQKGEYIDGTTTRDGREVVFAFVGDGSVLNKLKQYTERHQIENIVFIPYQKKEDLIYSLNAGDVHLCVNAKGIKGVSCPSKAYGIMAAGKPVLAVLEDGTEIRSIIDRADCGICSAPEDYETLADNIQWYIDHAGTGEVKKMGENGRKYLNTHLTKEQSIKKYCDEILKLGK